MITKKEIIQDGLAFPFVYEDYPFLKDRDTVALKHKQSHRWFVLIMQVKGVLYVNVKTKPEYSELLRNSYSYIIPAYHMNKEHWNTIIIQQETDKKLFKELMQESYTLTVGLSNICHTFLELSIVEIPNMC